MKSDLTIAVIIISHNQYSNLKLAIDSLFNQSRKPDQIVILDDGSKDETTGFLEKLQMSVPNVMCRFQAHSGIGKARKEATKLADADVIAVLDSDDILFPEALASYETIFLKYPELDLVYGNVAIIDQSGQTIAENHYRSFKTHEAMKQAIFLSPKVPFKHSAIAFKKTSYFEVGGYDENCKIKVDIDLVFKFLTHHKKIMHLDEIVAGHRIHQNNISRKRLAGLIQWYRFIFKYENSFLKRISFLLVRTFWELSKMIVEMVRNLMTIKA